MRLPPIHTASQRCAFTLIELLVGVVVFALLAGLIYGIVSQTGSLLQRTRGQAEQFREAREAFETITRRLRQATLNTYWDYYDATGNRVSADGATPPKTYGRYSELNFASGKTTNLIGRGVSHGVFFQAPLGFDDGTSRANLNELLNACGFYVEYGDDPRPAIPFLPSANRPRYRLMEILQPTRELGVETSGALTTDWMTRAAEPSNRRVLAENIVALVIEPRRAMDTGAPLAPQYRYDSRDASGAGGEWFHQLPPLVEVTMVAIDEPSASRLPQTATPPLAQPDFTETTKKWENLTDLTADLAAKGLNFRVFETTVPLRAARWSRQ